MKYLLKRNFKNVYKVHKEKYINLKKMKIKRHTRSPKNERKEKTILHI